MKEKEEELLKKVQALLEAAEDADQQEDALHGKGRRGDELPKELERAETRRTRIRELREQDGTPKDKAQRNPPMGTAGS